MNTSATRRAFVVGARSNLRGSAADAEAIFKVLCDPALGQCDAGLSVPLPQCNDPEEFSKRFRQFLADYQQGDQIVLYFSGHGHMVQDEYCLQMGETDQHLVPFSTIRTQLKLKSVDRAVIILDACYSGAATKGNTSESEVKEIIERADLPRGVAILASSSEYQVSYETRGDADHYRSVFTSLFLEAIDTGLKGKPTVDGMICVEDLQSYIKEQITSRPDLKEFRQHPRLAINNGEERIWLAKNKTGKAAIVVSTQMPAPVKSYLSRIADETSKLSVVGLRSERGLSLPIARAFIPLQLDVMRSFVPNAIADASSRRDDATGLNTTTLDNLFVRAREFNLRGAALLGGPGAGKSTVAKRLAWEIASWLLDAPEGRSSASIGLEGNPIPIFLPLSNYDTNTKDFRKWLDRETENRFAPSEAMSALDSLLRQDSRLWIFDGLDEIADESIRMEVAENIRDIITVNHKDYVLVTCRYSAYSAELPLNDVFLTASVRPLTPPQVEQFVHSWYEAALTRELGATANVVELSTSASRSLLEILDGEDFRRSKMRELRSNPLLLSVLCVVHHREGRQLPAPRMDLYERCVQVMLRSREWYPRGQSERYIAVAERALGELAWTLHQENNRKSLPIEQAANICTQVLTAGAHDGAQFGDGYKFLKLMQDQCGLLAASSQGSCEFLHLTFQEFFAAKYAILADMVVPLAKFFGEAWWREVTLLALSKASIVFVNQYFHEVLLRPDLEKHIEMFRSCLEHVQEAGGDPYDPVIDALSAPGIEPDRKMYLLQILRNYKNLKLTLVATRLAWDADRQVSEFAREIIQRDVSERPLEKAIEVIKTSGSNDERALAAWTLRSYPEGLTITEWLEALKDPDYRVRAVAAEVLGSLGERCLVAGQDLLQVIQGDEHYGVRAAAREAVRRLGVNNIQDAALVLQRFSEDEGVDASAIPTKALRLHVDRRTHVTFVYVPGGAFLMGSSEALNELPQRTITISPFWLARYPITNEEYELFLRENPNQKTPFYWDDRRFNQPQQPVVGVTWHDAIAYCKWAGYRLPREAEWEYACRAGTKTRYCFGDDEEAILDYAWIDKNSEERTHIVGTKKPNDWGFHDLHGNVWEWCADWYSPLYNASEINDPKGPDAGEMRVLRGGTFFYGAAYCRCARREKNFPERRSYDFGFRVVLDCESVPTY